MFNKEWKDQTELEQFETALELLFDSPAVLDHFEKDDFKFININREVVTFKHKKSKNLFILTMIAEEAGE